MYRMIIGSCHFSNWPEMHPISLTGRDTYKGSPVRSGEVGSSRSSLVLDSASSFCTDSLNCEYLVLASSHSRLVTYMQNSLIPWYMHLIIYWSLCFFLLRKSKVKSQWMPWDIVPLAMFFHRHRTSAEWPESKHSQNSLALHRHRLASSFRLAHCCAIFLGHLGIEI